MTTFTYDQILRTWLYKIASKKFVYTIIGPIIATGLWLIVANSGSLLSLSGALKLSYFEGTVDNDPNLFFSLLGLGLVLLGVWLFYSEQLRSGPSRTEQTDALITACTRPIGENLKLQGAFNELYKYTPSASAIRHIVNLDDPHRAAYDYKFAQNWVIFDNSIFRVINQRNLKQKELISSVAYFTSAMIGLCGLIVGGAALGTALQDGADASILQFACLTLLLTSAFFFVAWAMLQRIRNLNCALRLITL